MLRNRETVQVEPIVLEGEFVRLEPIKIGHLDNLFDAGMNEEILKWYPFSTLTKDDMRLYIENALMELAEVSSLPFVTIEKESNKIVGSTRFISIEIANKKVEIGSTWVNPKRWRTSVNTEAKILMLTHTLLKHGNA